MQPINKIAAPAVFSTQDTQPKTKKTSSLTHLFNNQESTSSLIPTSPGLTKSKTTQNFSVLFSSSNQTTPISYEEFLRFIEPKEPPPPPSRPPCSPKTSPTKNSFSPGIALESSHSLSPEEFF